MKRQLIAATFGMATLVGCGGGSTTGSDDVAASDQALDSTQVASNESAIMASSADAAGTATTADSAVAAAALAFPTQFTPANCAMVTQAHDTVTIVANDCTGPYGLVEVSGTINITYSVTAGGALTFVAAGTDIKANRATMTLDASGSAAESGNVKTLNVTSNSSGTGPRGNAVTRTGSYAATWGNSCVTLNGTWSTTVDGAAWSTAVSSYDQCAGACPAAGGTITHTNRDGRAITLSFDGSATADYSIAGGQEGDKSGTLALLCGSAS